MKLTKGFASPWIRLSTPMALAVAVLAACFCGGLPVCAAESVTDKVGAAASDAGEQISEASKAVGTKMQQLWQRIDEQRLKNRAPDQIVAWVIMGLLAGGLIHQFSKLNKVVTILLGLVGAFVGGIVANVTQVDLGMGPVLIRYEDLVASLAGGVVIVLVGRWLAARRAAKK